jgi:membrane-associated phospholipid phosphatase
MIDAASRGTGVALRRLRSARSQVQRPWRVIALLLLAIVLSTVYPSDPASYPRYAQPDAVVLAADHYGRFINTVLQVALPLLMRDPTGAVELAYVAIGTTVFTHGLKRLVNDWHVSGRRLGQRPSGPHSKHNMPSGHSSMSSCAVYFVCRRYGLRYAWLMLPVLGLTMYARVAMGAHTISAVLCGTLIGFVVAAFFTSRYQPGMTTNQDVCPAQ